MGKLSRETSPPREGEPMGAAKLREDNPKLIDIHCMAHRLELALMDVLKQSQMVSLVNDTLYLVWRTYHFSPKSSCELKQVCYELETRFYKPKPVKGTRWVPHLDRALKVFLKGENDLVNKAGGFSAVAIHMENPGETSRSEWQRKESVKDNERSAVCGLLSFPI